MRFEHFSLGLPCPSAEVADVRPRKGEGWAVLTRAGELHVGDRTLPVERVENPTFRLSSCERFVAVAEGYGRHGFVLDFQTGAKTMRLDRGDYHPEVSGFPLAFFDHGGKPRLVHGTDWNRLDVSDPESGVLLTPRGPTSYTKGEERPAHYLDFFHGTLFLSPSGDRIADHGWIWHPAGTVRTWSLSRWLDENPWEAEDGPSLVEYGFLESYWDGPFAWIDDRRFALFGVRNEDWDWLPGVTVIDTETDAVAQVLRGPDLTPHEVWPPSRRPKGWMAFDRWLFAVSPENGTEVWDLESEQRVHHDPELKPIAYHPADRTFLSLDERGATLSRLTGTP